MKWRYFCVAWIVLITGFLSVAGFAKSTKTEPIRAEKGELAALDWQFIDGTPLALKGDWQVIWGQLVEPTEFDKNYQGEYFSLPEVWNKIDKPGINGADGFATFRLHLQLPAYNRELSIHMISPHSAWRIYVDGVFMGGNGVVAYNKQGFSPHYVSRVLPATSRDSVIVLQVANFNHAYGGPGHAITVWDKVALRQKLDFMSLYLALVSGILLATGLIHLVFYLADRKHREQGSVHLWFALLCLILVVRISGIIPFTYIYAPESPYWSDLHIPYLSLFAAPAVYLLFFRAVFPQHVPKHITRFLIGFCMLMVAFVLLTPDSIFTHTRNFSIVLNVFVILYTLVCTVFALRDRQAGAGAILVSNFLFLLTAINDAVIYTDNGNGFDMTPFGILVLVLGYSYALLLRLQGTFQEARGTSKALKKLNLDLEKQVDDRTLAFKAATAKAENHAQERAQFIAAASHDLRQPLHALALLNAVLKSKKPKADIADLVEKQTISIDNLSTLLQDTLDTARAETGGKTPNNTSVDVSNLLQKIASDYKIRAQTRNIKLAFSVDEYLFNTDRAMLQRILSNLIDNALKAARTWVKVTARIEDEIWVFSIEDDGAGIAKDDVVRIFDSYVSLDAAEPDALGGYGLGLYVVNEFTHLLGGTIHIAETSNTGTRFILTLPNKESAHQPNAEQTQSGIDVPTPGMKILAIDDEFEILDAMQALLSNWQCSVRTAQSAADARAHIKSGFAPDVLLVDYHLYGTTGPVVIASLRALADRDIPAIIITGATEPDILETIRRDGFDMLTKPVKPDALGAMLKSIRP